MSKIPPYLKRGDTIGIVCPAGYMALEKVRTCIETLERWGYRVKIGNTVGNDNGTYFSGTDAERLKDLQGMLDDDSVQAVLCARGGYGTGRIIDHINFKKFRKNPKWLIGFSDITVLHCHLLSNFRIASLHAPMAAAFEEGTEKNPYLKSWKRTIEGKPLRLQVPSHPMNVAGNVEGVLVGGNLALLAHLVGTPSDVKTRGRILFLEDIGEQLYNVDRMMYQLKRAGKLKGLKGLIVGGFTDMNDTTRPMGMTAEEIIRDIVAEYNYPVCFGFPVSHAKENYPLKVGGKYELKVGRNVKLNEIL